MNNKTIQEKTGWSLDNSYLQLPDIFFTQIALENTYTPELAIVNGSLASKLGLDVNCLQEQDNVEVFGGCKTLDGSATIAQAYAGHQFGHFTMLGDGRAVLIGEQLTPSSERVDIHLKGSGKTSYSRSGDGKATLGPMLREYIISEAMHALGIPTTRSLAVVKTGEIVMREQDLPGAVLTRVAASHIRVGTFQYAVNWGSVADLKELADYTIKRHFPAIMDQQNKYLALLAEVIKRQASLVAKWQLVGFVHGVMNTDNMTISGETIDYGPCAFLDEFDWSTVFSSIDRNGRYAYGNQPQMAAWNLARFAETLLPLLDEDEETAISLAEDAIARFGDLYYSHWLNGMRGKLGLVTESNHDKVLVDSLLMIMQQYHADYTNTFRALTLAKYDELEIFNSTDFKEWRKLWLDRQNQESNHTDSQAVMRANNPAVIPRNHRVEEALKAAVEKGDFSVMNNLLTILAKPYEYTQEQEVFAVLPTSSSTPYVTYCGT